MIGIMLLSPSLTPMLRCLVPPVAGLFGYFVFKRVFTDLKILAVILTFSGVCLGCYVQISEAWNKDEVDQSVIGISLIAFSTLIMAIRDVFE